MAVRNQLARANSFYSAEPPPDPQDDDEEEDARAQQSGKTGMCNIKPEAKGQCPILNA